MVPKISMGKFFFELETRSTARWKSLGQWRKVCLGLEAEVLLGRKIGSVEVQNN
jgi:hypothetical protein